MLGGSRVQIAGPTAAFATIVAGIVAKNGFSGLVLATLIAGIMLVLMGVFEGVKLGTIICAFINGFLISRFSKLLEHFFEFKNRFKIDRYFK